jgi:hypothetical protein
MSTIPDILKLYSTSSIPTTYSTQSVSIQSVRPKESEVNSGETNSCIEKSTETNNKCGSEPCPYIYISSSDTPGKKKCNYVDGIEKICNNLKYDTDGNGNITSINKVIMDSNLKYQVYLNPKSKKAIQTYQNACLKLNNENNKKIYEMLLEQKKYNRQSNIPFDRNTEYKKIIQSSLPLLEPLLSFDLIDKQQTKNRKNIESIENGNVTSKENYMQLDQQTKKYDDIISFLFKGMKFGFIFVFFAILYTVLRKSDLGNTMKKGISNMP